MGKPEFVTLLLALAAQFRVEASEAFITGYWIGCQDLAYDDFAKGVQWALRECDFMPSAHQLRLLSGEESVETKAIHAWTVVLRSMSAVGAYKSVDFGPLVNSVVRAMGGWVELCNQDSEELREWGRKTFEATYKRLATSGVIAEMGAHLSGLCERTNTALGVAAIPVKLLDAALTLALEADEERKAST